jgi:hypothetical protein
MMINLDNQVFFKQKMIGDLEKQHVALLLMELKILEFREHFNNHFRNNHLFQQ